jgi:hypothetical protein
MCVYIVEQKRLETFKKNILIGGNNYDVGSCMAEEWQGSLQG